VRRGAASLFALVDDSQATKGDLAHLDCMADHTRVEIALAPAASKLILQARGLMASGSAIGVRLIMESGPGWSIAPSMPYREFESSIVSTRLKAIARHWTSVRGTKIMPSWNDISPSEIKDHLPIVFSYSYDVAHNQFFGHLAGNAIASVSSTTFKGASMSDIRPPEQYPYAFGRAKRVITEPALYRGLGQIYATGDRKMLGERITRFRRRDKVRYIALIRDGDGMARTSRGHALLPKLWWLWAMS
jgi:hypothetical protein